MNKIQVKTQHHFWSYNHLHYESGAALLPTLVVAVLPKCPLCLMSLMSLVGLSSFITSAWLLPLTLAFLTLTVLTQAFAAFHMGAYKPLLLVLAAAAGVLLGRFQLDSSLIFYLGVVMLATATFWSYRLKKQAARTACSCGR